MPADRSKPGAAAAREERECWIRDKYLRHVFLSTFEADGSEQAHDLSPHQRLYDAAQTNTIIEVRQAAGRTFRRGRTLYISVRRAVT